MGWEIIIIQEIPTKRSEEASDCKCVHRLLWLSGRTRGWLTEHGGCMIDREHARAAKKQAVTVGRDIYMYKL